MNKKKIIHEKHRPELDPDFMSNLLKEWEAESKNTKVNPIKKIDDI